MKILSERFDISKEKLLKIDTKYNLEDIVCKSFHELSSEIRSLMLPHKSVIELQRDLLRVAPFEVKQSILDKVQ